ncbi:MAG: hypothetical protein NZ959_11910, partial [Armatimonadetes bacterium]|nr:hypothetical protein [Armatimonadota bacterium]MDW8123007.1 hypothetical protein [Armatimonadota bacterium]
AKAVRDATMLPKRSFTLLLISDSVLYRFSPESSQPEAIWNLKGKEVAGLEAYPADNGIVLAFRQLGSPVLHLVKSDSKGQQRHFFASLYLDRLDRLEPSSDGSLLIVGEELGRKVLKILDKEGREVSFRDRTPLGSVETAFWLEDGSLLALTNRFQEKQWVLASATGTSRFIASRLALSQPSMTFSEGAHGAFVLAGGTLYHIRFHEESSEETTLLTGVSGAARLKDRWAIVKDGVLTVGTFAGGQWTSQTVDARPGIYDLVRFSSDGGWLVYRYRQKETDTGQVHLLHLATGQNLGLGMSASFLTLVR